MDLKLAVGGLPTARKIGECRQIQSLLWAVFLLIALGSSSTGFAAASSLAVSLRRVEALYADLVDDAGVVNAIDSGLFKRYAGKPVAWWLKQYATERPRFVAQLALISDKDLSADDLRAVTLMRAALGSALPADLRKATYSFGPPESHCAEAGRKDLGVNDLRDALYACFNSFGNNLRFEGHVVSRDSAITLLGQIKEPERRKALFFAFEPLWKAVNGNDEPDSPYRRRIKYAAERASGPSAVDAVARDLDLTPAECEAWLMKILETWRDVTPATPVEPWDYRYVAGAADRALGGAIEAVGMLPAVKRYYRDLGANLDSRGVRFDLAWRADKAPITYTNYITMGRSVNGVWRPTRARVSASYSSSGLYVLNMLVHESGHAVHYLAIQNRPAFMDIGDDFFCESFADVTSWEVYDPAWQAKYLGQAVSEEAGIRSRYALVTLESAWALFELRMLKSPDADPNEVWTDITNGYFHIIAHPEISWWAQRVQLVTTPGFMMNYGLGAVVTADLREQIRRRLGRFDRGDVRWYGWVSKQLLRSGLQFETSHVLQQFLRRPVSLQPIIDDIRRIGTPAVAGRL